MDLKLYCEDEDWTELTRYNPVVDCCEYINKPSGSIGAHPAS
jgi:hypothetical protein